MRVSSFLHSFQKTLNFFWTDMEATEEELGQLLIHAASHGITSESAWRIISGVSYSLHLWVECSRKQTMKFALARNWHMENCNRRCLEEKRALVLMILSRGIEWKSWLDVATCAWGNLKFGNWEEFRDWVFAFLASGRKLYTFTKVLRTIGLRRRSAHRFAIEVVASSASVQVWDDAVRFSIKNLRFKKHQQDIAWAAQFVRYGVSLDAVLAPFEFAVSKANFKSRHEAIHWSVAFSAKSICLEQVKELFGYAQAKFCFETAIENIDWALEFLSSGVDLARWEAVCNYAEKHLAFQSAEEDRAWALQLIKIDATVPDWQAALAIASDCLGVAVMEPQQYSWIWKFMEQTASLETYKEAIIVVRDYWEVNISEACREWIFTFMSSGHSMGTWRDALEFAKKLPEEDYSLWVPTFLSMGASITSWECALSVAQEIELDSPSAKFSWAKSVLLDGADLRQWKASIRSAKNLGFYLKEDCQSWLGNIIGARVDPTTWLETVVFSCEALAFGTVAETRAWILMFFEIGASVSAWDEALKFAKKFIGFDKQQALDWAGEFLISRVSLGAYREALGFAKQQLGFKTPLESSRWASDFLQTPATLKEWRQILHFAKENLYFKTPSACSDWVAAFFSAGITIRECLEAIETANANIFLKSQHEYSKHMTSIFLSGLSLNEWHHQFFCIRGDFATYADHEVADLAFAFLTIGVKELELAGVHDFVDANFSTFNTAAKVTWISEYIKAAIQWRATNAMTCSICLDEIMDDAHALPCAHRFHPRCFQRWRERGQLPIRCPMCRGPT